MWSGRAMISKGSLETSRLVIRPFESSDIPGLTAMFSDPAVSRYVGDGGPLSEKDAALWVRRSGENLQCYGYGTGAVVERSSGRMIGWAGFARPEVGAEQIIYGLVAAHWQQGFGREILKALLQFADSRGLDPVLATVYPANANSIRLLRSQGFRFIEHNHGGELNSDLYRRDAAT
jgi:ribosomal-protein-alanine N-acetyltransferase